MHTKVSLTFRVINESLFLKTKILSLEIPLVLSLVVFVLAASLYSSIDNKIDTSEYKYKKLLLCLSFPLLVMPEL